MTENEKMRFKLFNTCLQLSHNKYMEYIKSTYDNDFDTESYEHKRMIEYAYELSVLAYNKFCEKEEL